MHWILELSSKCFVNNLPPEKIWSGLNSLDEDYEFRVVSARAEKNEKIVSWNLLDRPVVDHIPERESFSPAKISTRWKFVSYALNIFNLLFSLPSGSWAHGRNEDIWDASHNRFANNRFDTLLWGENNIIIYTG